MHHQNLFSLTIANTKPSYSKVIRMSLPRSLRMGLLIHHFLSLSVFTHSLMVIEKEKYTDKAKHFV